MRLDAPSTAPAGGEIEVRVSGDIGEHMTLTVVPAGSLSSAQGASRGLEQGTEMTALIRRLPGEPGDYEIRCTSNWGAGKHVYASRKLTIQ